MTNAPLSRFFKPLSAKVMPQRFISPEGKDPLSEAAIVKQRKEVSEAFTRRQRKKT